MKHLDYAKAREALRKWLVKYTANCALQKGHDDTGWPCGTCTMHLLTSLGLDAKADCYQDKNDDHDRHNEVWRAILQIRDAKLPLDDASRN